MERVYKCRFYFGLTKGRVSRETISGAIMRYRLMEKNSVRGNVLEFQSILPRMAHRQRATNVRFFYRKTNNTFETFKLERTRAFLLPPIRGTDRPAGLYIRY